MAQSTWFCRCGHLNQVANRSCESCKLARTHGERKDKDLSDIVKPPPEKKW